MSFAINATVTDRSDQRLIELPEGTTKTLEINLKHGVSHDLFPSGCAVEVQYVDEVGVALSICDRHGAVLGELFIPLANVASIYLDYANNIAP